MQPNNTRGTIILEQAELIDLQSHPADQYLLRLAAPRIAALATPGSFLHVQCDPHLQLRRPISLLGVDAQAGELELMFKVVGEGTSRLASRKVGDQISALGPIGRPFEVAPKYQLPLLIGGGVGVPPMLFLAATLQRQSRFEPVVILGSEVPLPFATTRSQRVLSGAPDGADHNLQLLEQQDITGRLCSLQEFDGTYRGYVTELAERWLDNLTAEELQKVAIFACGPPAMLEAVAVLARQWQRPCQVSLEEYMACGVGGCAGCAVAVKSGAGTAMRRVCVDGPVFAADQVFSN